MNISPLSLNARTSIIRTRLLISTALSLCSGAEVNVALLLQKYGGAHLVEPDLVGRDYAIRESMKENLSTVRRVYSSADSMVSRWVAQWGYMAQQSRKFRVRGRLARF